MLASINIIAFGGLSGTSSWGISKNMDILKNIKVARKFTKNLDWNFEFTNRENHTQFDKQKLKLTSLAIDWFAGWFEC